MAAGKENANALRDYPPVLDTRQVCEILHINRKTLYKMIEAGVIPGSKSGRGYRVTRENIIAHLNRKGSDEHGTGRM